MYKIPNWKGELKIMYTVTLILPTDMTILENKFNEVMADIVAKRLSHEELGILIEKLEEQEEASNI